MAKQYTKEEFEKLFEKLPEELQEAIFSLETAENILNVCQTYGITDERVGQISDYVGQVLMGLFLSSEFQKTLEQEVGLPETLAKAINHEINRFVFYPLKPFLEEFYKMEIPAVAPPAGPKVTPPPEEKPPAPPGKDVYREPVE